MKYYFAKPQEAYSMLGTGVTLNTSDTYLCVEATNQPEFDADNPNLFFVIFTGSGDWELEDSDDIEMCIGFMLKAEELQFIGEPEEMNDEEAIDKLFSLNNPAERYIDPMEFVDDDLSFEDASDLDDFWRSR